MLAGEQRRAVPCPPAGLVVEHIGQRLMDTPTFPQAGALRDRRPDQRMPEADRLQIGVHDTRLDRRPTDIEIHGNAGNEAARLKNFVKSVLVAERRHQQKETSRIRQI
jgi:hypothetical protein